MEGEEDESIGSPFPVGAFSTARQAGGIEERVMGGFGLGGFAFGGAPFTFRESVPLRKISDGMANTLMISELLTPKGQGWQGPIAETSLSST